MRKLTIAGNLVFDHVKVMDEFPAEGRLATILSMSRGIGGCAGTTPCVTAILDPTVPVSSIGLIGDDEAGAFIKNTLESSGVDISGIKTIDKNTSFTDVMQNQKSGERTFFHSRGANALFDYDSIDYDKLDCDIFHLGYALLLDSLDCPDPEYGTRMARVLAKVSSLGIKTSLDVVSEQSERFKALVLPCLKHIDYLIFNEVEASQVTGIPVRDANGIIDIEAVKNISKELLEKGVHDRVVIHCPEYGFVMTKDGVFTHLKSLSLPKGYIKGSVGAGDSFCAGVLLGLLKGYSDTDCLRLARAAAAANLSASDSLSGLRDEKTVMQLETLYAKD